MLGRVSADYARMRGLLEYLTRNCCAESAVDCAPEAKANRATAARRRSAA